MAALPSVCLLSCYCTKAIKECHLTVGESAGASAACSLCPAGTYGTGSGRRHCWADLGAADRIASPLTRRCCAFRSRGCRRLQPLFAWDILDGLRCQWTVTVAGAVC